jgi:predicted nuclease of restriction endonuclease-like (RecB) superfamily
MKKKTIKKSMAKGAAAKKSAGKALSPRARRTTATPSALLTDLRLLIEQARSRIAQAINSELVLLYWRVGQRINQDVLKGRRAEYGKEIVATVSQQLTEEFGQGFTKSSLTRMCRLAEYFPDVEVVSALSTQLSWSHFVEILPLKDQLRRDFYAEMSRIERWSVRTLRQKIGGMLYERTALSKKPERVIENELQALRETDRLTPDLVFRDPYLLDFLGLAGAYQEKDLETAILHEMEKFLLELGGGFSFVARQKRVTVGRDDFYLDLLFYHRGLRRLVAVELKLEKFQPAHKGQMELYLRWLDRHERQPHEESPVGLILCQSSDTEQVELLRLDESGIRVAEYMTELPSRELLQAKLHQALEIARARQLSSPEGMQG